MNANPFLMRVFEQTLELDDVDFVALATRTHGAAHELSLAGQKLFRAALIESLAKSTDGIGEVDLATVDSATPAFHRGLQELVDKGFLKQKDDYSFWTNPAMFSDRVTTIEEFWRR